MQMLAFFMALVFLQPAVAQPAADQHDGVLSRDIFRETGAVLNPWSAKVTRSVLILLLVRHTHRVATRDMSDSAL